MNWITCETCGKEFYSDEEFLFEEDPPNHCADCVHEDRLAHSAQGEEWCGECGDYYIEPDDWDMMNVCPRCFEDKGGNSYWWGPEEPEELDKSDRAYVDDDDNDDFWL